jgi:hypothetical protein
MAIALLDPLSRGDRDGGYREASEPTGEEHEIEQHGTASANRTAGG